MRGIREVRIVMNGVTGRMGRNQHLIRSILAIRKQGGIASRTGGMIMPVPVLAGRGAARLEALAAELEPEYGPLEWTVNVDEALEDEANEIYFDSTLTRLRAEGLKRAIGAGKAVYCEKPIAGDTKTALELAHAAQEAGVKNGVVQDKLWLPGMRKLKYLIESGFFGRILAVRGEFGYWVFDGVHQGAQRPSWNYRLEEGGGIMVDMFCHWRYVMDNLFGEIRALSALGVRHIPRRIDEAGEGYECTADDAAFGTFELADGVICQMNSSWAVRVRRDDLFTLQVDGTAGSAVAGLRDCVIQHEAATPKAVWNPDIPSPLDYRAGWTPMPDRDAADNAFKVQWELFLRHVVDGDAFPWDLRAGARGVQLAELGLRSWKERRWMEVPPLV